MSIGQIVAEITATTAGLRRAQQDASRQFGDIQNEANATGKVVKMAFAVAASAAVMMFVAALAKAADGANDTRKAMLGLENVAKAYGVSVDDATKITKDFTKDGLINMKNALS